MPAVTVIVLLLQAVLLCQSAWESVLAPVGASVTVTVLAALILPPVAASSAAG